MDEFFYGTLPEDTQDFTQVLKGVRRSLGDVARGVSYYPYDLIGAPVDIINMALTPMGLGSQQPVMGSDYLRNIGKSLGLAQDPTGSIPETVSRIGAGFINPAAGARAVGQIPQAITRGANVSADKLVQMITQNPRATAMGVIDETSMPFMQAMAPKTPAVPGLMEPAKSDIGFYSQLEAATIPLQNKGTGDQYLAQIQKSAGVKPEEIQWTGLDEFLKGKKSVTKAEIQDYLSANRVDVREVRLGNAPLSEQAFNERFARRGFSMVQTDDGPRFRKTHMTGSRQLTYGELPEDIQATIERQSIPQTKHHLGAYQGIKTEIPGGENYREILLTLPEKQPAIQPIDTSKWSVVTVQQSPVSGARQVQVKDEQGRLVGQRFGFQGSDRDAIQEVLPGRLERETDIAFQQQNFRSSHFDQPNILAHMRVNDRVVDGKKTLFIEEIQSDWHQAGRKKGYQSKDIESQLKVSEERMAKRGQEIRQLSNRMAALDDTQLDEFNALAAERQRLQDLQGEEIDLGNRLYDARRKGVPDAPFKTSWHELTLKRAIQEASEKGYDQIAFTTGKTQAERYDLSKQINNITYKKNPNGNYYVDAEGKDNQIAFSQRNLTESQLEDYVGKEIAQKIIKNEGESFKEGTIAFQEGYKKLSGLDLQVGGEGMKGFYDNILPKSLEKLGKKFDAKVGKTEMDGVEVWQMDITPKMRESVTTKGQPLFAVPAIGAGLLGAGMYQDEQMY